MVGEVKSLLSIDALHEFLDLPSDVEITDVVGVASVDGPPQVTRLLLYLRSDRFPDVPHNTVPPDAHVVYRLDPARIGKFQGFQVWCSEKSDFLPLEESNAPSSSA